MLLNLPRGYCWSGVFGCGLIPRSKTHINAITRDCYPPNPPLCIGVVQNTMLRLAVLSSTHNTRTQLHGSTLGEFLPGLLVPPTGQK